VASLGKRTERTGTHRLYAYGLVQRDYNNDELNADDMINGMPAIPTQFHYDSHYVGIGAAGALTDRLAYGIEAVYEGGHTNSSSFTLDDDGNGTVVPQQRATLGKRLFWRVVLFLARFPAGLRLLQRLRGS